MPKTSIFANQYAEVGDSFSAENAEKAWARIKAAASASPTAPEPKAYCTAEQWDEAVAYRDMPPEEKATTPPPAVAMLLGWAPSPWTPAEEK